MRDGKAGLLMIPDTLSRSRLYVISPGAAVSDKCLKGFYICI